MVTEQTNDTYLMLPHISTLRLNLYSGHRCSHYHAVISSGPCLRSSQISYRVIEGGILFGKLRYHIALLDRRRFPIFIMSHSCERREADTFHGYILSQVPVWCQFLNPSINLRLTKSLSTSRPCRGSMVSI